MRLSRQWRARLLAIVVCGMPFSGAPIAQVKQLPPNYKFSILDTLGGKSNSAAGINDSGQVTGYANTADDQTHAVLWNGVTATDLGTFGGRASFGHAINSVGQIAGDAYYVPSSTGVGHAILWHRAAATALGPLVGAFSGAEGINNPGQVVGWTYKIGPGVSHATLWNGATSTDLGAPFGAIHSKAVAINDAGLIVGNVDEYVDKVHAVLWKGSETIRLDSLGGPSSTVTAINNQGQAVGWADTAEKVDVGTRFEDYVTHATRWKDAAATDLGVIAGNFSQARSINNSGQIVGRATFRSDGNDLHAAMWDGGRVIDINSLLPADAIAAGWVLVDANGINDSGWIVGDAVNSKARQPPRAFLLSLDAKG